jgi:rubrerythrin
MGSCLDLRKYQDAEAIQDVFSQLVSGKKGYKAVIERKKEPVKCSNCGLILEGAEKFCPECGTKTNFGQKLRE